MRKKLTEAPKKSRFGFIWDKKNLLIAGFFISAVIYMVARIVRSSDTQLSLLLPEECNDFTMYGQLNAHTRVIVAGEYHVRALEMVGCINALITMLRSYQQPGMMTHLYLEGMDSTASSHEFLTHEVYGSTCRSVDRCFSWEDDKAVMAITMHAIHSASLDVFKIIKQYQVQNRLTDQNIFALIHEANRSKDFDFLQVVFDEYAHMSGQSNTIIETAFLYLSSVIEKNSEITLSDAISRAITALSKAVNVPSEENARDGYYNQWDQVRNDDLGEKIGKSLVEDRLSIFSMGDTHAQNMRNRFTQRNTPELVIISMNP